VKRSILSRMKISTKLALSIVFIVAVQAAIMQAGTSRLIKLTNEQYYNSQMEIRLRGISNYLSETLNDMQVKVNLLAGQKKVVDYTEYRLRNLLHRELVVFKTPLRIDSIAIFLAPDKLFLNIGDVELTNDSFKRGLADVFNSSRRFFITRQELAVRLWVFSDIIKDNSVLGTIGIAVDVDRSFVNRLENNTDATVLLSIGDHIIDTWSVPPDLRVHAVELAPELVKSGGSRIVQGYMAGAIPLSVIGESDDTAVCLLDMSAPLKLIARHNQLSTVFALLIGVLAVLLSYFLYRITFLTPFLRLRRAVRRISDGHFEHAIEQHGHDELGEFAGAFEQMRRSLIRRDEQLSQLERFNNLILENVRSGVITVDRSEKVISCNPAAFAIIGLRVDENGTGASEMRLPEFGALPECLVSEIRCGLKESRYVTAKEIRTGIGSKRVTLSLTTSPLFARDGGNIGVIAIVVDITRERRLEKQLERSSRMAAMGEMAAGVAHQIRNPIAIMKVSAGMLQADGNGSGSDTEDGKLTDVIVNEIDNLDHVVSNLLNFTRPIVLNSEERSIREVIDDALRLVPLYQYPGSRVDVRVHGQSVCFPVDRNILEQVIANLVQNGLEAMPEGGTVCVRAFLRDNELWIEVEDTGMGIDEATAKQIFMPFFTTKDRGTGLGLSIVHRLIEQHGGTIDVHSRVGEGALFRIVLRND